MDKELIDLLRDLTVEMMNRSIPDSQIYPALREVLEVFDEEMSKPKPSSRKVFVSTELIKGIAMEIARRRNEGEVVPENPNFNLGNLRESFYEIIDDEEVITDKNVN